MKGVTGDNMLMLLEKRLDNVVYRLGMATSRNQARQLVSHGHITLNGRKITIPSAVVRPQDTIAVRDRKPTKDLIRKLLADNSSRPVPPWLTVSRDEMIGKVEVDPTRDVIPTVAEEQLIVEFYSK